MYAHAQSHLHRLLSAPPTKQTRPPAQLSNYPTYTRTYERRFFSGTGPDAGAPRPHDRIVFTSIYIDNYTQFVPLHTVLAHKHTHTHTSAHNLCIVYYIVTIYACLCIQ